MIKYKKFMNANAIALENDTIHLVCLPDFGGKIVSLYHKERDFELLFQNPAGEFRKAKPGSDYSEFEACGFDDAFPNIDGEIVKVGNNYITYFDHGEIWAANFEWQEQQGGILLSYCSPYLNYRYEKLFTLSDNIFRANYTIKNEGNMDFPCFWTCHCLVKYRSDMRLIFPNGTNSVVNVIDSDILGHPGLVYRYPRDYIDVNKEYDFTRVPEADSKTALKYYCCERSQEGRCGYIYPSDGIKAEIGFNPKELPYLGFWLTTGGYRGDINCALEPSNGFFDSITTASKNGKCPVLGPGKEMNFFLEISLDLI